MEPAPSTVDAQPRVRPDIISEAFLATLREHGVVQAQLFGSMVDHTDGPESDIDLLVTFGRPVSLFEELDLAEKLQRVSGRKVDLMTKLHPVFAPYITPTLVSIPL
ncbi:MAG TPA: nucleotidyltransferase domain-containing protein [Thermomicrobiales bacterium]|nr:nucleotidyltransferase domain-containing protein [Thermomicrobiales bacterium]